MYAEKTIESPRFGTFLGVYLPCILNIFGVILYLRLSWLVGVGGIAATLCSISVSFLIACITAFSVSVMATNMRLGGGGVYYMLSRTFGVEAGSAIGVPLYLAQTFAISLYIRGFTESFAPFVPWASPACIAAVALCFIGCIAQFFSSIALRTQLVLFAVLILSLFSICRGDFQSVEAGQTVLDASPTFWGMFAVFFPAVTGLEAILGFSDELRTPHKSLPQGLIAAVATGFVLYTLMAIGIALSIPRYTLMQTPHILQEGAWSPQLVLLGIWGGALSSSISCLLSAPRTLSALVSDGVFPRFLGRGSAVGVSAVIAYIGFAVGDINKIAPILTMFFLISYAMLNLATSLEGFFENPSWRPTMSISPLISASGFVLCLFCMLMMDVAITLISCVFIGGVYYFIKQKSKRFLPLDDIRRSILLFLSKFAIYRLSQVRKGPKSWRPNVLAFVGDPQLRSHLMRFTENIAHGKGMVSVAALYPSASFEHSATFLEYKKQIEHFFMRDKSHALVEVKQASDIIDGMKTLIKGYGIGELVPNTIVMGATQRTDHFIAYAEVVLLAYRLQKNVVIIREGATDRGLQAKRIDVWWGGKNRRNSDAMLVFAHMLQSSSEWKHARLHLRSVAFEEKYREALVKGFREFSAIGRLQITPEVVSAGRDQDIFRDIIAEGSRDADLIFLGLRPPHDHETAEEYALYYKQLLDATAEYPPVAFVLSGEPFPFKKILK